MTVADPSACRHMSPTSLAYAALTQQFLRTASQLPAWDKSKVGAGAFQDTCCHHLSSLVRGMVMDLVALCLSTGSR